VTCSASCRGSRKIDKIHVVRTIGIFGVNINTQKLLFIKDVTYLGTPGRIMDLTLDNVIRFEDMQKLVIDEFDEMLNLGFRTQSLSWL
jgi:ATP-dependent RNA helicase RhlE